MNDYEFTEALVKLVEHIQEGDNYPESYALMIAVFIESKEAGETNRMSVVLAIKAIDDSRITDN